MVSEITRFYCKPDITSSWFLRQGSLYAIVHNGFWKGDHDFLIAFHSDFLSGMHGFQDIEVLLQADYEVWLRILKGRPRLYIHVQLTLFVYLERFRRSSTFSIWLGFPYCGRTFGGLGAKWPRKHQMREKHWLGEHFLAPNGVFWAIVREIISIRLASLTRSLTRACAQEKRQESRKAGRKKSQKKWICVERPLAGGFQPNLAHVFVSRT